MATAPKPVRKPAEIYEANLADFFLEVTHFGASTVRTALLMRWMGWDKQTAGFWADVQERFQEALEPHEREDGWQLFAVQNDSQMTLMCFDPEKTEDKDRWWQPVKVMAERPTPGRRKAKVEAD